MRGTYAWPSIRENERRVYIEIFTTGYIIVEVWYCALVIWPGLREGPMTTSLHMQSPPASPNFRQGFPAWLRKATRTSGSCQLPTRFEQVGANTVTKEPLREAPLVPRTLVTYQESLVMVRATTAGFLSAIARHDLRPLHYAVVIDSILKRTLCLHSVACFRPRPHSREFSTIM